MFSTFLPQFRQSNSHLIIVDQMRYRPRGQYWVPEPSQSSAIRGFEDLRVRIIHSHGTTYCMIPEKDRYDIMRNPYSFKVNMDQKNMYQKLSEIISFIP